MESDLCMQCMTNPADPTILGMSDICRKCYDEAVQLYSKYKASRAKTYPQIDQILQDLYLGNEDAACDQKIITNHKIKAVLVCGSHLQKKFPNTVVYKQYEIADDPRQSVLKYFEEANQWVSNHIENNNRVLIHCAAGVSRSASFVIAFLMKHQKKSFEQAFGMVKSKRPIICPNSGFISQLKEYQAFLSKK